MVSEMAATNTSLPGSRCCSAQGRIRFSCCIRTCLQHLVTGMWWGAVLRFLGHRRPWNSCLSLQELTSGMALPEGSPHLWQSHKETHTGAAGAAGGPSGPDSITATRSLASKSMLSSFVQAASSMQWRAGALLQPGSHSYKNNDYAHSVFVCTNICPNIHNQNHFMDRV